MGWQLLPAMHGNCRLWQLSAAWQYERNVQGRTVTVVALTCAFACRSELATFQESVNMHSGVPKAVEDVIHAMPHDAHPMAILLTGTHTGCVSFVFLGGGRWLTMGIKTSRSGRLCSFEARMWLEPLYSCRGVLVRVQYMPLNGCHALQILQ